MSDGSRRRYLALTVGKSVLSANARFLVAFCRERLRLFAEVQHSASTTACLFLEKGNFQSLPCACDNTGLGLSV